MRERAGLVWPILCLGLAALLAWQLARLFLRPDPLAHLSIPAVPALAQATRETNAFPRPQTPGSTATNSTPGRPAEKGATNSPLSVSKAATNSLPEQEPGKAASNALALAAPARSQTNSASRATSATNGASPGAFRGPALAMGMGMTSFPGSGLGNRPAELPPATRARVERITESEILGPVMRPLPMALLGIAGNVAFLRAPSGQTGLVKAGDQLGALKLLRIGTNRVLIELDGKPQELMIFSGFGGESLLPK